MKSMRMHFRRIALWLMLACSAWGFAFSQTQSPPASSAKPAEPGTLIAEGFLQLEGPALVYSEVRPGPGILRAGLLSDYHAPLRGTAFDTPVFFLGSNGEASEGSGSMSPPGNNQRPACLVLAGSHANEIAGVLAAYWLIEHCRTEGAGLIVLPRANTSAATHSAQDAHKPRLIALGQRTVRYGYRLSNPQHETMPDPLQYLPPRAAPALAPLAGREMRNLNRQFPGTDQGSMTAQTAFAVMQLLRREHSAVAFDLHEAGSASSLAWSIITRPEYMDDAALAALELGETAHTIFHLESSRDEFAGYSHWEWGTEGIRAYLIETFNPAQPGDDPSVDQLHHPVSPLARRVFVHLKAIQAILSAIGEQDGGAVPRIQGLPQTILEVQSWLEGTI